MKIKITNKRGVPISVLGQIVPANSKKIIDIVGSSNEKSVLNRMRNQNDISYIEVNADGSSGKLTSSRGKKRIPNDKSNVDVKEGE